MDASTNQSHLAPERPGLAGGGAGASAQSRATLAAEAETAAQGPRTLSVTMKGKRYHVPYRSGLTVLEACKEAGVKAPHSCQRGFCGTCLAVVKYGDVQQGRPQRRALSEADQANGRILTCQARPGSTVPFGVTYDEADFRRRSADGDRSDAPVISTVRSFLVTALLGAGVWLVHFLRGVVG